MKVSIIILNFNGKGYIVDCLESVKRIRTKDYELKIIIVDNASTDGSDILIEQKYKDFRLLKNKENLGFTGGNNVGIDYALKEGSDYVMLLNSDTVVNEDLLISLISVAESDKKIGILGPKIYFAAGKEYHKDRYKKNEQGKVFWYAGGKIDWRNVLLSHRGVDEVDEGQYDRQDETGFVSGCCLLFKREVCDKIGVLDNKYYLYLEDADYCRRAKNVGYRVIYVPSGKLWHINAGSSSVGGSLQDYFITRNRLIFGFKFTPLRTKAALLREAFRLLFTGREWQKTAVRDFFLFKFGKGSWKDK